jgi:NADP-dependent 3-hydroxy acid dehydrogenase YdfG
MQDILVNNAGINIPKRSLQDISIDDWRNVIDINVNGTFHLVHAVLPHMRAQSDGLIVNITSIAGKRTISTLAGSSYCASKFAMNSLGEAINLEEYENGEYIKFVSFVLPTAVASGMACQRKAGCQVFAVRTYVLVRSPLRFLTSGPTRRHQRDEPICCSLRILALRW